MALNPNDTAFYTQDSETGAIIDTFDTFDEAFDSVKKYHD